MQHEPPHSFAPASAVPLPPGSSPPPSSLPPPHSQPRRAGRFWSSFGRLLLFLVLTVAFAAAFAFVVAGLPWLADNELAEGALMFLPATVGATVLLLTIADRRPLSAVGLPLNGLGARHLFFGIVVGSGLSAAIIGFQWMVGWVEIEYGTVQGSLSEVVWAPSLAVGFLVIASAAASEELMFRGYGLQQLMRGTHAWGAMILSSVVFGLVHASNPNSSTVGIVNTVLFGLLFGVPLLRQRSLWIPTGMHFGWNFSLACLGANISGLTIRLTGVEVVPVGPALWSGAEYGPEASVLATFAVIAAGVLLWRLPLRSNDEPVLWDRDAPSVAGAEPGPLPAVFDLKSGPPRDESF